MASGSPLESWIREQYYEIGIDHNGEFRGKNQFKLMLINLRPKQKSEIRQLVNRMIKQGIPKQQAVVSSLPQSSKTLPASKQVNSSPGSNTVNPKPFSAITSKKVIVDSKSICGSSMQNTQSRTIMPRTGKLRIADQGMVKQAILNPKIQELKAYLKTAMSYNDDLSRKNMDDIESSIIGNQSVLLSHEVSGYDDDDSVEGKLSVNDIANGVLFTADLLEYCDQSLFLQYGLLGSSVLCDQTYPALTSDRRLYLNSNIPFSIFICGVQGSGKSHTTSCLIENCLIRSPILGVLQKPLSALVFHFDEYTSYSTFVPSEAAFLAIPDISIPNHAHVTTIRVLVSPSNYFQLNALYSQIPGVTVQPFKLHSQDLTIGTILTLMSVDQTQATPLYMGQVTKILRRMASESEGTFNYLHFKRQLDEIVFDKMQRTCLDQRLDLLESFLDLECSTASPTFSAGEITILDLSCPFVDANTACILFQIGLRMYLEASSTSGKIVVVDEAHKYMTNTPSSKHLTESLLTVIRQQRHYGARVIISTQEPTISPQLIGLYSITIIHRFSSPEWFNTLRKHISTFRKDGDTDNNKRTEELFDRILKLGTGQALIFAPTAIVRNTKANTNEWVKLSTETLELRVRKRMTWDGGKSVLCL
ncbi:MAG: hypothetical protein M1834_005207 [Cirrosporium novae-zelandiae]|nr:MAG: hypothetical protein M1834_005207 [Cirrosporium novae-zelandiae]